MSVSLSVPRSPRSLLKKRTSMKQKVHKKKYSNVQQSIHYFFLSYTSLSDLAAAASVKFARLRKKRYREHALAGLKKVAMLKKKVKFLEDLQKRHMMELKLLSALRISATTSPRDTELEARVNASIEKLSNTHRRFERKLYKTKRKRAIAEAKLDLYLIKLSPKLKYTDIHAKNDSFYLSPIQEESEAELEQEQ